MNLYVVYVFASENQLLITICGMGNRLCTGNSIDNSMLNVFFKFLDTYFWTHILSSCINHVIRGARWEFRQSQHFAIRVVEDSLGPGPSYGLRGRGRLRVDGGLVWKGGREPGPRAVPAAHEETGSSPRGADIGAHCRACVWGLSAKLCQPL